MSSEQTPVEDDVPDLYEEEEDDALWEDSNNEDPMVISTCCLFCDSVLTSPEETFKHCNEKHGFNICAFQEKHQLEYFQYIKMINFCRTKKPSVEELMTTDSEAWFGEAYLKPVIPDDGLLQFDIEDIDCLEITNTEQSSRKDVTKMDDLDKAPTEDEEKRKLLERCRLAEERATQAETALHQALEDMTKMRTMAGKLLTGAPEIKSSHEAIRHLNEDEDDAYISGYSHFSIHEEMLKDKVRTEYYRDCIYGNEHLFHDKVVLDVGCGTGILSMFAARAGASHVIGVDMSDIIYQAMDIVRENGFEDKITLLKGRMEDLVLPVEKVDIIISEWMGYFLLFESMLDTVLWARDHYLREGGLILPDFCDLYIVGIDDQAMIDSHVKFWEDVYGYKMNCMKSCVVKEASVGVVKADSIATAPVRLKEIDICTCSTKDLEFTNAFEMQASKDTELTAIVGYFDIKWVLKDKAPGFSTSPTQTPTHWKQTIFLLENPIPVKKGDVLEGNLACKKNRKDPRSLDVTIDLQGKTYSYILT